MNLKIFVYLLLGSICFPQSQLQAKSKERPNFVFILTDDHRYDVLGCTGNKLVKTPNIDKLADEGLLFTNAHITSAICTPSRVSIFLSQFERKHGVNFNSGTSVSEEGWQNAYPVVLRNNGYYTGYIGKNHAPVGDGGYESGLIEASFDYWYGGHKHLGFYPKKAHAIFRNARHNTQIEILTEGVSDFFSNEYRLEGAKHFLESRPDDKPFCLNICFNLPHDAGTGSMKLLDEDSVIYKTLYRDLDLPMPENYVAKKDINKPKLPPEIHFADERQGSYDYVDTESDLKERMTRYLQAVTGVDGLVGELVKALKDNGLDDNTIIVFTSDHGIFWGEFGFGGKALCYEVCTRVPFIVYNPMASKAARSKKSSQLVQSIDVAPTFLEYAGIKIPKSYQGKSIKQILEGEDTAVRDYLFTENLWSTQFGNPRCEAIQNHEWKYIRYYKNENLPASEKIEAAKMVGMNHLQMLYAQHDPDIATYRTFVEAPFRGEEPVYEELFQLSADPHETSNLAKDEKYKEKLIELRNAWKEKVKYARGEGLPKVHRYTKDGMLERSLVVPE